MFSRALHPELQKKAETELNEVPNRTQEDITYIKEWLIKQPHLKARTDDYWITVFLRGCKFSLERTKEKIDMFYTIRTLCPEFFVDRDPFDSEIQKVLSLGLCLPLPKTDGPAGPRIILNRFAQDPNAVHPIALMKVYFMVTEILLLEDDNYVIAGSHLIMDMKGITMSHMTSWTPTLIKKMSFCYQEAFPLRPKGLHYLNTPSVFDAVFNLFKPFLNKKLKSRLFFHNTDMDSLNKHIQFSILPEEYGGEGPGVSEITAHWKAKMESYKDWFIESSKYGSDERKRIGISKTIDEVFGVEGSFRKLSVD